MLTYGTTSFPMLSSTVPFLHVGVQACCPLLIFPSVELGSRATAASLPHWTVLSDSSEAHCFLLKMDNTLTFPAQCLQTFRDGPAFFSQSSVLQRICLPLFIVLIAQSLFILGYFISEVK